MENSRWYVRLGALLLIFCVCATTVSVAAGGSQDDPLVTLSYLNGTFWDGVVQRIDQRIAASAGDTAVSAAPAASSAGDTFTVVTLSQGQTLTADIGAEVMLRVGSAVCTASGSPGLVDETDGATIDNGASLITNHLYMATIEGRGVRSGSGTVKLLVRGGYQLG